MKHEKNLERLLAEREREINSSAQLIRPPLRLDRRQFLAASGAVALGLASGCKGRPEGPEQPLGLNDQPVVGDGLPPNTPAQCPYCGVGCGTLIFTENDRISLVMPDPQHPANRGLQCIKGLSSNEPIEVDRLTKVLIRRDMSDPLIDHVSETKGRFDDEVFREATWEEAEQLVADKIAVITERFGGNSVGLYSSGQLPLEAQWLENVLMKGVLGSNTVEGNTRLGMSAAVSGYLKSFGSDGPPNCFADIESADLVCHWGHNARSSHPVLFWRIIDHKLTANMPTLVVDPRRTGTVRGFEEVARDNSYHLSTINGDMAIQNAIAHVLLNDHPEAVAWDLLREHAIGWEAYVAAVQERYSPEQVQHITGVDPAYLRQVAAVWATASVTGQTRGEGGVLCFTGVGYNQHLHGESNTVSLINLLALSGNIGRPGAGPFSMTGQPNSMGERLAGNLTDQLPFNRRLDDAEWRSHIAESWRVPASRLEESATRRNPGMAIGMMERALTGDVHAMFLVGATHIGLPDLNHLVRPALTRTFNIVHEIYRDAPNNLYADVVLPASPWGEWVGGTFVNSERRLFVVEGIGKPLPNTKPDLDIIISNGRAIANRLGLAGDEIFPYQRKENGWHDPEEVLRDILRASRGSDADLSGILEVERLDRFSPYEQIRELRGIHWPAPTAEHALNGGIARRYMNQETGWEDRPYGSFGHPDGKLHVHLCEQDYTDREEIIAEMGRAGVEPDYQFSDHQDVLRRAASKGLHPELPDADFLGRAWDRVPNDKYPFWIATGIVYEHFRSAKTIRANTTSRLVREQYVEMHVDDARDLGVQDGDWVRVVTRRGSYEARCSVGLDSVVRPARNEVPRGFLYSPWNLSVADSAVPEENKWLVNAISHRAYDPVSGQVDFKKLAGRIEKIA